MSTQTQVTLVDEQDHVVGTADRLEAHRGQGMLHRAASVFLFRRSPEGGGLELLVQQRSAVKIVAANLWANTACGNCRPAETPLACATRRLQEELGIGGVELVPMVQFVYQVACEPGWSEHEYDHLFAGWYDGNIQPNPAEVQRVAWVDWATVFNKPAELNVTHPLAPWVPLFINLPAVRSAVTDWLNL